MVNAVVTPHKPADQTQLLEQILATQQQQQELLRAHTELIKSLTANQTQPRREVRCFGCNGLGHIRRNCNRGANVNFNPGNGQETLSGQPQVSMYRPNHSFPSRQ